MPQGDKSAYTDKQKRKAEHIEESYEARGAPENDSERIAWPTVNKDDGGGKKSGAGRGAKTGNPAAHKGGKRGGKASAARSASAKKAAATRKRNERRAG